MKIDRIFEKEYQSFEFNREVADVFDDMANRSIPFYAVSQELICSITRQYYQDDSWIIDLGCSTGNTIIELLKSTNTREMKILGIDYSESMLRIAKNKIPQNANVLLEHQSISNDLVLRENVSVVILNLTLQFVSVEKRLSILENIYKSLNHNGILLLFEKEITEDFDLDHLFEHVYFDFKRKMGYSEKEIQNKKSALEGVLVPNTNRSNEILIREAGFNVHHCILRWVNFAGYLAIKRDD